MTMMALVDYGLILVFFLGIAGLLLAVVHAQMPEPAPEATPASSKAKEKEPYVLLATLVTLLLVLTFFARNSEPKSGAK